MRKGENEPFGIVTTETGEYPVTPSNAVVYSHIGALSVYNHIFVVTDREKKLGTYVWTHMSNFDQLHEDAIVNGCTLHTNLRQVAEVDKRNYEQQVLADLDGQDTIPDDWFTQE